MSHTEPVDKNRPRWIRSAVDFGALAAFIATFAVLRLRGVDGEEAMISATWVLMGASALALLVGWLVERRLAWLPAIAGGFALVFGGLTVIFHDSSFMKLKLTVQNGLLAAVLLGSVALGKNIGKTILGAAIAMPDAAWRSLTLRYGLFFAAVAVVNEFVWRTQSNDAWVAFRGGLQIAAIVFAAANIPFILKHASDPEAAPPESPDPGM